MEREKIVYGGQVQYISKEAQARRGGVYTVLASDKCFRLWWIYFLLHCF